MKIIDIKTYIVGVPPPHHGGLNWVFLKLVTDEGIEGWGELPYFAIGREHLATDLVKHMAQKFVLGKDPFNIEKIWESLYKAVHPWQHPGTLTGLAMGGIEMACWDIIGKELKQPVYKLLGGKYRDKIRTYTYIYDWDPKDPESAGRAATKLAEQGFTAFKIECLPPISPQPREISLKELQYADNVFRSIREWVGYECDVALGTHGQFNTHSAIRLAKVLEKYDLLWFEEPVPPENVDEMARVAQHTSIPIATGERLSTKWEFRLLLEKQAAQIIQLDIGINGILESKKIAGMAEAYYAQIAPHLYSGPVSAAASVQLDATCPNFLIQEGIETWGGFWSEILEKPFKWEKGYIILSDEPGLGIGRVKEEVLDKYPPYDALQMLRKREEERRKRETAGD